MYIKQSDINELYLFDHSTIHIELISILYSNTRRKLHGIRYLNIHLSLFGKKVESKTLHNIGIYTNQNSISVFAVSKVVAMNGNKHRINRTDRNSRTSIITLV
jgi:hypothetical protein